jgi:transposase
MMRRRKAPASAKTASRQNFSGEFKEAAVRRVLASGRSVPTIAKELGVGESTLYRWVSKLQGPIAKEDDVEAVLRENRELKEAVAFLQDENEILRRAALAYARNHAPARVSVGS